MKLVQVILTAVDLKTDLLNANVTPHLANTQYARLILALAPDCTLNNAYEILYLCLFSAKKEASLMISG